VISIRACLIAAVAFGLVACAPTPLRDDAPRRQTEPPTEPEVEASSEDDAAGSESSQADAPAPDAPAQPEEDEPAQQTAPEPPPEQDPAPSDRDDRAATPRADQPAAPPSPAALTLSGRLTLTGGEADPTEAVIYFVADDPVPERSDADAADRSIVTRDKTLTPTVTAVRPGTALQFPNEDPILHNLFSVSAGNRFDVGIYGPDETPSVTMSSPGVVNIYCNVHHDMHAHVLVVDTPWRTQPDAAGRFELADLPVGPGTLHVWHRQTEGWEARVTETGEQSFAISLEVTRPMLPAHRDKTGQPYNRRDRDPYR
jgi:plastocyanin